MLVLLAVAICSLAWFYNRKRYVNKASQTYEEDDMDPGTPSISVSFDIDYDYVK